MQQVGSNWYYIYSSTSEYYDSAVVVWLRAPNRWGREQERARGTRSVLDTIVFKNKLELYSQVQGANILYPKATWLENKPVQYTFSFANESLPPQGDCDTITGIYFAIGGRLGN